MIDRRLAIQLTTHMPGLTLCLLLAGAHLAFGQDTTRAVPEHSTLSGVYTAEQATRGRNVFLGSCKSCHAPESHVGPNFTKLWVGKPLLELFKYVSESMPENDPGSLAPETNADVVAYLLQLNAMPAGKTELPAERATLREIRVEAKEQPKPGGR